MNTLEQRTSLFRSKPKFLSRNSQRLQTSSLGVLGAVWMLSSLPWVRKLDFKFRMVLLLLLAAASAVFLVKIQRYYKTFIFVETRPVRRTKFILLPFIAVLMIVWWSPELNFSLFDPVMLIVGTAIVGAECHEDFLLHRVLVGLFLVIFSLAPLAHWMPKQRLGEIEGIVYGSAMLVVALMDNLVLIRALRHLKILVSYG